MTRIFENTVFARATAVVVIAAGLFSGAAAQAGDHGAASVREVAVEACMGFNEYAPVTLVDAVEDGMGDTLVWLEDRDGDLWMCNADADGNVYFNVFMEGDLLEGDGLQLVGWEQSDLPDTHRPDPQLAAEQLCTAVLEEFFEETSISITTVSDGFGDYLVWLSTDEGGLWACNASADNILFAFEEIDGPLNVADPLPVA